MSKQKENGQDEKEKKEHFMNALSNYGGVLAILDRFESEGIPHNYNAPVPDNWQEDNLILLGEYLEMLNLSEHEKRIFRDSNEGLIRRYGVEVVWKARRIYAAEILFIRDF